MKTKVLYCCKCKRERTHDLVDKQSVLSSSPTAARVMLATLSLGFSEFVNTATVEKKWECRRCGSIRRG